MNALSCVIRLMVLGCKLSLMCWMSPGRILKSSCQGVINLHKKLCMKPYPNNVGYAKNLAITGLDAPVPRKEKKLGGQTM